MFWSQLQWLGEHRAVQTQGKSSAAPLPRQSSSQFAQLRVRCMWQPSDSWLNNCLLFQFRFCFVMWIEKITHLMKWSKGEDFHFQILCLECFLRIGSALLWIPCHTSGAPYMHTAAFAVLFLAVPWPHAPLPFMFVVVFYFFGWSCLFFMSGRKVIWHNRVLSSLEIWLEVEESCWYPEWCMLLVLSDTLLVL